MRFLFHICAGLGLIVFQTSILSGSRLFDGVCDLLIPYVLFLAAFRPRREAIPVILFLGLSMDNLSGGPFGLYCITYLWLFVGVSQIIQVVLARNRILMSLLVASGVVVENIIFFGTSMFLQPDSRLFHQALKIGGEQLIWAVCAGPLLVFGSDLLYTEWENLIKDRFSKENGDIF